MSTQKLKIKANITQIFDRLGGLNEKVLILVHGLFELPQCSIAPRYNTCEITLAQAINKYIPATKDARTCFVP